MRSEESTQFSVDIVVKDRLDRYKAENKEEILAKLKARRRLVTNSMVIKYLLDGIGAKR